MHQVAPEAARPSARRPSPWSVLSVATAVLLAAVIVVSAVVIGLRVTGLHAAESRRDRVEIAAADADRFVSLRATEDARARYAYQLAERAADDAGTDYLIATLEGRDASDEYDQGQAQLEAAAAAGMKADARLAKAKENLSYRESLIPDAKDAVTAARGSLLLWCIVAAVAVVVIGATAFVADLLRRRSARPRPR